MATITQDIKYHLSLIKYVDKLISPKLPFYTFIIIILFHNFSIVNQKSDI